jgi:Tol biopolymer transport system component
VANGDSFDPSISEDGRYVAFTSGARLVSEDTNVGVNVYVRDIEERTTQLASVNSGGAQRDGDSSAPSMSANGRYVAFTTDAGLGRGDTNLLRDVYVRDLRMHTTRRVSVASDGAQSTDGDSFNASISGHGRKVTFASVASTLAVDHAPGASEVYVHNLVSGVTRRVATIDAIGNTGFADSALSADGRYVSFFSSADDLVPGDTNGTPDIFVRDLSTGATARVSVSTAGAEADGWSFTPVISRHGGRIAFESQAENLVTNDANLADDVFVRKFPFAASLVG